MRKIITLLLTLTFFITLSGCLIQEEYTPINDALELLSINTQVSEDFELELVKENVELTWSSNSNAIKISNNKALVTQGKNDTEVILTVDAKKGELTGTKSFSVNVIKDLTFPDTVTIIESYEILDNTFVLLEKVTAIESSSIGTYFTDGSNVILANDLKNIEINKVYDLKGMKITSGVATLQNCSVYDTTGDISNITPKNVTTNNIGVENGYFKVTGELKYENNNLYLFDGFESILLTTTNINSLKLFSEMIVSIDFFSRGEGIGYTYSTEVDLGLSDSAVLDVLKDNLDIVEHTKYNITLPQSLLSSSISWSSNNSNVLSIEGVVNRQSVDTVVSLTATIKLNNTTITKVFNVTVIDISNNYLDELFISEYYHGSNSYRYIEIYNPTDLTIDLTDYSIKQTPDNKDFPTNHQYLEGELEPNETIIIMYSINVMTEFVTYLDNNNTKYLAKGILIFNGNDCIGLFRDEELIDLFGIYNDTSGDSSWEVPGGTTNSSRLIRNKTTGASPVWNPLEWYATAVPSYDRLFDDAGKHSFV